MRDLKNCSIIHFEGCFCNQRQRQHYIIIAAGYGILPVISSMMASSHVLSIQTASSHPVSLTEEGLLSHLLPGKSFLKTAHTKNSASAF